MGSPQQQNNSPFSVEADVNQDQGLIGVRSVFQPMGIKSPLLCRIELQAPGRELETRLESPRVPLVPTSQEQVTP